MYQNDLWIVLYSLVIVREREKETRFGDRLNGKCILFEFKKCQHFTVWIHSKRTLYTYFFSFFLISIHGWRRLSDRLSHVLSFFRSSSFDPIIFIWHPHAIIDKTDMTGLSSLNCGWNKLKMRFMPSYSTNLWISAMLWAA